MLQDPKQELQLRIQVGFGRWEDSPALSAAERQILSVATAINGIDPQLKRYLSDPKNKLDILVADNVRLAQGEVGRQLNRKLSPPADLSFSLVYGDSQDKSYRAVVVISADLLSDLARTISTINHELHHTSRVVNGTVTGAGPSAAEERSITEASIAGLKAIQTDLRSKNPGLDLINRLGELIGAEQRKLRNDRR